MHRKNGIGAIFAITIAIIAVISGLSNGIENVYYCNVIVDLLSIAIVSLLLLDYRRKYSATMFDPVYFITIIYLFLYFVAPIYDIFTGEYLWFGYQLFNYGVQASLIALVGYIAFYFFYTVRLTWNGKIITNGYEIESADDERYIQNKPVVVAIILAMYVVCFAANIYYLVHSGYTNILYLLTLGLLGTDGSSSEIVANIGFISMLSYSLPTLTLLYWEYGNSKILKLILFVPMLMLQIARGFRFFIIQIFVTFVSYNFIKNKRQPSLKGIVPAISVMMLAVLLMTMFRNSMRDGMGMAFSTITADSLEEAFDAAFWENLRIYRNFYGMVHAIPSEYGFVWGRQLIIGTIVMVVPRAIWPSKISSYGGVGLEYIIGSNLRGTGQAYPTIGEYYYAAGILGVLLCMAIFGIWASKLRDKYMKSDDELNIIIFSVLLGCILQLMIRGYFPSNFWYLVFALLPIWMVKLVRIL